jgi:formamidopyrimidine-DNA glycosylase
MPELPDLVIVGEFLAQHIIGTSIRVAEIRRPIVVRNLLGGNVIDHLIGRQFAAVHRRGKYLLLSLDDDNTLAINPMLAGRIRYGEPLARHRKRDVFVLGLDSGRELRYNDAKDMGKVYVADDLARIPGFASLGPEANDPSLTLEAFRQLLLKRNDEIKSVLTDQSIIAGIGNAYADEILWRAGLYPFQRPATLDEHEQEVLYRTMRTVLAEAVETLRERVGDQIDVEVRDFMGVHGKKGQPCPQCGTPISQVMRGRRPTHFCRTCQPGLMLDRKRGRKGFTANL